MPKRINIKSWISVNGGEGMWRPNENNKRIQCRLCRIEVDYKKLLTVENHIKRKCHNDNLELYKRNALKPSDLEEDSKFLTDLTKMLVGCNFPLSTVERPLFISFMHKYFKRAIPSRFYVTRCIESLSKEMVLELKHKLRGKDVFLSFMQSNDKKGRPLAVVLMGPLDGNFHGLPYFINLDDAIDLRPENLTSIIIKSIHRIFGEEFDSQRMKIIVTDGSASCVEAADNLRFHYPNLHHVTCLVAGLQSLLKGDHTLQKSKNLIQEERLDAESIKADLKAIQTCISSLAKEEGLPLLTSFTVLESLKSELRLESFRIKLEEILKDNDYGYEPLRDLTESTMDPMSELSVYRYAPLVNFGAERVFKMLREASTSRRQHLGVGLMRDVLNMKWNYSLQSPPHK